MDLNEIVVFARVVDAGSFVGASKRLEMPTSTVSRKVSSLEERLGARLLHRTTRALHLTDAGRTYYRHAAQVVAQMEEAELAVQELQAEPRGPLRVTMPLNFGHVGPVVAEFMGAYPKVELDVVCTDRVVDLVNEGFDVGLRAGSLPDSGLVARSMGHLSNFLVASPAYLERYGTPQSPDVLGEFDGLLFSAGTDHASWKLGCDGKELDVEVNTRMVVNDFELLEQAVLAGLGIALLPSFRGCDHVHSGRLVRVLPEWTSPLVPLHAVYPTRRYVSPNVRAFLDFVEERFTP